MNTELLNDVIQLLNDCLVMLCPDGFTPEQWEETRMRFRIGQGTIRRISVMTDRLRKEMAKEK